MSPSIQKIIMNFYQRLDGLAAQQIEKSPYTISCRRGCVHCCYNPVVVGAAEGHVIAQELLRRPDWEDWVKRLIVASQPYCGETFDRAQFFQDGHACPFLDLASQDCSIYEFRPPACRYHYSIDPVEYCVPSPVGQKVRYLNFLHLENLVLQFNAELLNLLFIAPLPMMVAFMMVWTNSARAKIIKGMLGPEMDPSWWTRKYALSMGVGHEDYTEQELQGAIDQANRFKRFFTT